ncbi:Protein yif1b [Mactra antiquata]
MDAPSNFRQTSGKRKGKGKTSKPQLFDDTSVQQPPPQGYSQQQPGFYDPGSQYAGQGQGQNPNWGQFPGQQIFNDPMANMAMQYGTSLAGQGKDIVNKNLEKYVSTSKLKYYFAVDTSYVGKKLLMLFFPYTHSDWSIKFDQDQPVAPRFDENAPDLYIPTMAFVTYVLVSGIVLGTQNRFTPEQLGLQASTALVWLIIELAVVMLSLYIMNLSTDLKYMDVLSYTGYKFVGMIFILLAGMFFQGTGYYGLLAWFSAAIVFFLVRTLKSQITSRSGSEGFGGSGTKRSLYLILSVSLAQPLLMWWLTRHIVFS